MEKFYYLTKKKYREQIASKLLRAFSLPEINYNLAIYFKTKNQSLEIGFINNQCYLRSRDKKTLRSTPEIRIENKNIKFLLRILKQFGLNKATISEIIQLDFFENKELIVSFRLDTVLGDLLAINKNYQTKVSSIFKINISDLLDSDKIDQLAAKKSIPSEIIFNKYDSPNPKIQDYTDRFSIDLLSGITTISHKISAKSNDYSIYEKYFESLTQRKLDSDKTEQKKSIFFKPLSIVIPSYNSDKTIVNVLYSIESQELNKKDLSNLEVVVIDDGSINPVFKIIEPHLKNYSFKPKIIRLEQNQGLSIARNMGYQLSMYENILFIDSDILLAKNYLYEHSVRLQMIPNSLFISFKENITIDSNLNRLEQIKKGLPVSNDLNDKRIYRSIEQDTRWSNKTVNEGTEELLSETNLFKNFGYGRTVNGCFDLPSMVVGHNMSMRKEIVKSAGGFSNNFSGWGLEDTYFGAKVIANGNFIIPVLTTNVYHVDHPSRSGSPEKQLIEHKQNTKIYNDLIHQKI